MAAFRSSVARLVRHLRPTTPEDTAVAPEPPLVGFVVHASGRPAAGA
ncbi:hypothetical protein ACTJKO_08815 [Curtobacterium sp. 22159]